MQGRTWTILNAAMLLVFVFSAVVQMNDPDPLVWVAMYGAAAFACVLALMRRGHWSYPALVSVVSLVWVATYAPRVLGRVPFGSMFGAWEMADTGIEEARETYGLMIVAVWMVVLAVRTARAAKTHAASAR